MSTLQKSETPKITRVNGNLEIHHNRGVVYFHLTDEEDMQALQQVCLLRICGLKKPIPDERGFQLDISVQRTTNHENALASDEFQGIEKVTQGKQCDRPPQGWYCTREFGHEGACAARQTLD